MERTHITKKNNGGSPRYMAPVLFDDKSKITEKIDIWAMGCIFIEIFGGPLPYEGCNNLADLTRTILMEHRSPHVPSKIPPPIANIIRSMLDFDHKRRPNAAKVVEELKGAKRALVPRA
jgi:serine/threonine protein kinase